MKIKKSTIYLSIIGVLAVLLVWSVISNGKIVISTGSATANVVSEGDIEESALDFFNTQLSRTGGAEIISISEESGVYKIIFSIDGQEVPLYFTKDGNWIQQGQELVSITGEITQPTQQPQQEQDVPKSDKPKVELFVFSYCPFSLQFQKAILSVYELLKNEADIDLVAIGAMHGEYEKIESLRQICIEKEYGRDKLWEYIKEFAGDTDIGDCRNDMECSKPLVEKLMGQIGISNNKINSCVDKDAEKIYQEQNSRARELGISGSPTFVINDVKVQVSRTSEAIKEAICNAFTESPEECSQTLSTQATTPGFGYSAGTDTGAQC